MAEMVNEEITGTRKFVLGFDAGCGTCSDLARRIEERVGDKLLVENLNDPQLITWREEALGKNAKWAPTLFEVEDEKVLRAWAGWRMGWALSRSIGAAATWQVMQALGEVGAAPRVENSRVVEKLPPKAAETVTGMSRGQFLKGVGGAAIAMSVLSGTDFLSSPVNAAVRTSPHDIVKIRHLTGTRATQVVQAAKRNIDTRTVLRGNLGILNDKQAAYLYTLRNGLTVHATLFFLSGGAILTSSIISRPIGNRATSVSKLWKPVTPGSKKIVVVRASEGGTPWRVVNPSGITTLSTNQIQPLADCPPVGGGAPGGSGRWCTITTNQCISRGPSLRGRCVIPTLGAAATCTGGAAGAIVATVGTLGLAGGIATGAAAAGCAATGAAAFTCCREYKKAIVWCRG
jgi:hypothetical protein